MCLGSRVKSVKYPDWIWVSYGLSPQREVKFHPTRKWRFDFAWVDRRIAVEIDGGIYTQGRHTRGSGFVKDMEKMNAAGLLGWRVFRFTPDNLKRGVAQQFMWKVIKGVL